MAFKKLLMIPVWLVLYPIIAMGNETVALVLTVLLVFFSIYDYFKLSKDESIVLNNIGQLSSESKKIDIQELANMHNVGADLFIKIFDHYKKKGVIPYDIILIDKENWASNKNLPNN